MPFAALVRRCWCFIKQNSINLNINTLLRQRKRWDNFVLPKKKFWLRYLEFAHKRNLLSKTLICFHPLGIGIKSSKYGYLSPCFCSFLYLHDWKIFIRIHKTTKLLFIILRGKKHITSDFSPTATAGGIDNVQSWPATLDSIISMMSSNHWQRW